MEQDWFCEVGQIPINIMVYSFAIFAMMEILIHCSFGLVLFQENPAEREAHI